MNKLSKTNSAEGSIFQVSSEKGLKIEEVMLDAEIVVMVDQSGSMRGERQSAAERALEDLQRKFSGKVILIEFESIAEINLSGKLKGPRGSTNMAAGLEEGLEFEDGDMKFFLISDGEPNSAQRALDVAERYESPINTIYVGSDQGIGLTVMNQIADITSGLAGGKIEPKMLGNTIMGFLKEA